MARSYGAIYHRIWADPDFRALDVNAQHLYLLLISQPQLNLAGVLPLQPRKWASCTGGQDIETVQASLMRLRRDRFVVVDDDHEEVLIRSFILVDGGYRTPGVLVSVLKFAEGTQSSTLRAALAVELGRLGPLEGKTAERGMASIAATRLALTPKLSTPEEEVIHRIEPIGEPIPDAIPDGFLGTHPRWVETSPHQPIPEPIADTSSSGSGSGSSLSPGDFREGGRSGRSVETARASASDGPPRCTKHDQLPAGDEPPCGACKRLRENWEATRAEQAKPRPLPPLCGDCDNRWIQPKNDDHAPATRCPTCHPLAQGATA